MQPMILLLKIMHFEIKMKCTIFNEIKGVVCLLSFQTEKELNLALYLNAVVYLMRCFIAQIAYI